MVSHHPKNNMLVGHTHRVLSESYLLKMATKRLFYHWVVSYMLKKVSPLFGEDSHFDKHMFQRGW